MQRLVGVSRWTIEIGCGELISGLLKWSEELGEGMKKSLDVVEWFVEDDAMLYRSQSRTTGSHYMG